MRLTLVGLCKGYGICNNKQNTIINTTIIRLTLTGMINLLNKQINK